MLTSTPVNICIIFHCSIARLDLFLFALFWTFEIQCMTSRNHYAQRKIISVLKVQINTTSKCSRLQNVMMKWKYSVLTLSFLSSIRFRLFSNKLYFSLSSEMPKEIPAFLRDMTWLQKQQLVILIKPTDKSRWHVHIIHYFYHNYYFAGFYRKNIFNS